MMRICHLTPSFLPDMGGMETMIDLLAQKQVQAGHQAWILTRRKRNAPPPAPQPYQQVQYRKAGFNWNGMLWGLLRHHRQHRFDLVHAHGVIPAGWAAALFSRLTGVPFIFTSHGGDARQVTRFGRFCIRRVVRRAAWGVAISAAQGDLLTNLGLASAKLRVIHNGADLAEFTGEASRERPAAAPYVLFAGRLLPVKGPDLALETFAQVHACHPEMRLALMGQEFPEKWAEAGLPDREPRRLAATLGIADAVDFLGLQLGVDKARWFRHATLLLVSSRSEALSVVTLEAMAAGVPVVAFRVGGLPELVRPGQTGRLAEPGDCADLARQAGALLADPALARTMSDQAREAAQTYDWNLIINDYLELYRSALSRTLNA